MDRVFISSKDVAKKNVFKQFMGNNGKSKRRSSDARTEYFPYAGGNGIDGYEFDPQHLSYEPAESMIDTDVDIEEDTSLRHRARRVLLRGSKYEVYEPSPSTTPSDEEVSMPMPEIPPAITPVVPSKPAKLERESSSTPSVEPSDMGEFWTLQWMNNIPTSVEAVVPYVRDLSRRSVVLYPVDAVAEQIEGFETIIAGVEVFIFMLVGDVVARIVQFVCSPATLVIKLIFKLF